MNPKVDEILGKAKIWKEEMQALRKIALDSGLNEEVKWYQPVYTHNGKNIAIIGSFKDFCTFSFFKGALLMDPENILEKPGENTQSARLVRITSLGQVERYENFIKDYIKEAVNNEESGIKVEFKKTEEYPVPEELLHIFDTDPDYEKAFKKLTPGRQRGYLLHFSSAKQPATRINRIVKLRDKIFEGKGYNEI